MKIDGICEPVLEMMGAPPSDAQILSDEAARDPSFPDTWNKATDQERADWLEQARGRAEYNMTPEQYAKYIAGQKAMTVYSDTAGMDPQKRGAILENYSAFVADEAKRIPVWAWVAGGGVVAFLLFRRRGVN